MALPLLRVDRISPLLPPLPPEAGRGQEKTLFLKMHFKTVFASALSKGVLQMFIGAHCPKCGKRLKYRGGRSASCRCGWGYMFPESKLEKLFLYGRFRGF